MKTPTDIFYDLKLGHVPYCVEIIFKNQEDALRAKDWGYENFGSGMWTGPSNVPAAQLYNSAKWCMAWMNDDLDRGDSSERVKVWFLYKEDLIDFVLRWG